MDEKTFIEAFEKYHDSIYRFVYYRLYQNKQLAEDVTQEVFLKVWKNRKSFIASGCSVRSWLYISARNQVIDVYKKKKIITGDQETAERAAKISDSVENDSLIHFVIRSLDSMNDFDRELVILHYINGVEIKEIADIIKKGYDATKVAVNRAFIKLKEKVNELK